ncbi:MAG: hypothetical protein ACLQVW_01675, partial [Limisphaerales bacterium]
LCHAGTLKNFPQDVPQKVLKPLTRNELPGRKGAPYPIAARRVLTPKPVGGTPTGSDRLRRQGYGGQGDGRAPHFQLHRSGLLQAPFITDHHAPPSGAFA